jgi:putative DNA primase/helicase
MTTIKKPLKLAAGEAGNGADGYSKHTPLKPTCQALNPFSESMAEHGLSCPDAIVPDGKVHRFHVSGDKSGSKNGWYVFYGDNGLPAGSYGSWKTGETFTWCAKSEKTLSDTERTEWRKQIAKAKKARDQELKRIHLEAREKAAKIWKDLIFITEHPYLTAKGVKVSYPLREDNRKRLVIPIIDTDGTIHSLQFINSKGNKKFLIGGAITGHFSNIDGTGNILLVCEGYSTGASLHEATGYPVVVAFNAGNLKAAAEALRKKSPGTNIIICGDDDYQTEGNPGITKGKEAAQAVGAVLVVPKFKDQKHRGTDFNDVHQVEGLEAVKRIIEDATEDAAQAGQDKTISPDVAQKTIEHLASLAPFEYDQQRVSMAKELDIRIGTLDAEVEKIRRANSPDKAKSLVEELEPWPEPVPGAEVLDTIYKVVLDYVVMPERSAVAFSLWTLLTYCYNAFRILPVLGNVSPEKRCGKTRLLEVLSGLAYRAFPSCNLTPATVYRVIEKCKPCFLIDEADTFLPQNDELRGILNSGHTVKNAFVTRINPDTMEPERFSTWCPKAIALIGKLPSTLDDRAIIISLKRKLPTETVKRLGLDFDDKCLDLRRKCKRWANDNTDQLKASNPQLPDVNNDRALDNWTPLVAIADLIGGSWPEKARDAMVKIESAKEDDSARVMLLQDIQKVFAEHDCKRLWTKNLVNKLVVMEDRPWSEWKRGKPLSGVSLARLLKPFGIKPIQLKEDGQNKRGYELKQFEDDLARYTSYPHTPNPSATPLQPNNHGVFEGNRNATPKKAVAGEKRSEPASIAKGSRVAFQRGGTEGEDIKASDQPEPLPEDDQGQEVIEL